MIPQGCPADQLARLDCKHDYGVLLPIDDFAAPRLLFGLCRLSTRDSGDSPRGLRTIALFGTTRKQRLTKLTVLGSSLLQQAFEYFAAIPVFPKTPVDTDQLSRRFLAVWQLVSGLCGNWIRLRRVSLRRDADSGRTDCEVAELEVQDTPDRHIEMSSSATGICFFHQSIYLKAGSSKRMSSDNSRYLASDITSSVFCRF